MNSTISFVVPCFNCEKTLKRAVFSLINQTNSDIQIVLVDDGSSDNTPVMCDEFADEDERIVSLHQRNLGLMRTWKNGTLAANGKFVAFCDSDDYFDTNFAQNMIEIVTKYSPQMIVFGMLQEYENGRRVPVQNLLKEGFYERREIEEIILPNLFFNGGMQSELINKSRCDKMFSRDLILEVLEDLPDIISIGEDSLTTFLSVLRAKNILCIGDYYPYHYVRNSESMIGKYDPYVFEKIETLYESIRCIAQENGYNYPNQIIQDQLSTLLLFVKKEAERNPKGYQGFKRQISEIRKHRMFKECASCEIKQYDMKSKLFAKMIINGFLAPAYYITRFLIKHQ